MGFERKQFTFYRSFWDAMQQLSPRNREKLALYIIEYALNETEPNLRNSTLAAVFATIRPILDKARIKAMSGKSGGEASGEARSKIEAKSKQNEANVKQGGVREGERDKEGDRGGEREQGQCFPGDSESSLFADVFEALRRCEVLMEDKDRADCERLCAEHGARAVIEAIDRAKEQNVPRWSYIRAIVTSGGVSRRGGSKGSYIRHDDPASPAMLEAVQAILDWEEGEPLD